MSKLFGAALAAAAPTSASGSSSSPSQSTTSSATQSPATPSSVASSQPNIRVAIWNVPTNQTNVVFSANGPYDVYDKNGNLIAGKQAGEQISVNVTNPSSAFAKLVPRAGTILEIVSYSDLAWNKATNYNKFRGNLELVYSSKSAKLWVVNELPLEDYLKGVAETNQGLAMEYLKTMAVAARTYAYHYQQWAANMAATRFITSLTQQQTSFIRVMPASNSLQI